MEQGAGNRLHIVQSTDWKDAVITLLEPRSPYRPWRFAEVDAEQGEPVVFVLNTDPATVVSESALVGRDGIPGNAAFPRQLYKTNLMDLTTLATLAEVEYRTAGTWQLEGDDAINQRAVHECRYGAHPTSRFGHTSVAAARILLLFWGRCDGCKEDIDLTGPDARDRVFVHTVDPYVRPEPGTSSWRVDADDWPAVMCWRCRDQMEAEGHSSVVDFKFATHPPCPECGARRTRATFYGEPSDPSNVPPWSNIGGCCPSPRQWCCAECWHQW